MRKIIIIFAFIAFLIVFSYKADAFFHENLFVGIWTCPSIECNGGCYGSCPSGNFCCPSNGGAPTCTDPNHQFSSNDCRTIIGCTGSYPNFCNNQCYSSCPSGTTFSCPSDGSAPKCTYTSCTNPTYPNFCNNNCYSCPSGYTFYCPTDGSGPECWSCPSYAPIFCNRLCHSSCASGQTACCPANGGYRKCVNPDFQYSQSDCTTITGCSKPNSVLCSDAGNYCCSLGLECNKGSCTLPPKDVYFVVKDTTSLDLQYEKPFYDKLVQEYGAGNVGLVRAADVDKVNSNNARALIVSPLMISGTQ